MIRTTLLLLLITLPFASCKKEGGPDQNDAAAKNVSVAAGEAQQHNEKGMELYHKKAYADAAKEFRLAIASDPNHKLANYNLACVMALQFDICEPEPSAEEVLSQLKAAAKLDPEVRTKAPKDRDFAKFHGEPRFLEALDLLPGKEDAAGWKKILTGRQWNIGGCGAGVYGSICNTIRFRDDSTFQKKEARLACLGDPESEGCEGFQMQNPYRNLIGSYEIKNGKAVLHYDSGETEELGLPIREDAGDPCGA